MGSRPSFPIVRPPISFEPEELYTPSGKKDPSRCKRLNVTEFEIATEKHFQGLLARRKDIAEAREKINDIDKFLGKFPKWTHNDLFDLRTEFMAFDLNNDGTIDLPEMNKALDELGDTSPIEERETYFAEIDIDQSDSLDFEEFLEYVYSQLLRKSSKEDLHTAIGKACSYSRRYAMLYRVMTVPEQVDARIF